MSGALNHVKKFALIQNCNYITAHYQSNNDLKELHDIYYLTLWNFCFYKGGINTSVQNGGIYIKSLVPGGSAEQDRRIQIGNLRNMSPKTN